MGLPNITIVFQTAARKTLDEFDNLTAALIIKDSAPEAAGGMVLESEKDIPSQLSKENQDYIKQAFMGYITSPKRVVCYVMKTEEGTIEEALSYLETVPFDWLAAPLDCEEEEAQKIVEWIKAQWELNIFPRAVLPDTEADFEGIVNFSASDIVVGEKTYQANQYCSRIAGILCGTPLSISSTGAPLLEVSSVKRLSKSELDAAVDAGKTVIYHDGEKVKLGRAVTSLTTLNEEKTAFYQKVKLVNTLCQIQYDLKMAIEDNYIGKYPNNYDNKCILMTAVQEYFTSLENEGVLQPGSTVEIDLEAQKQYLKEKGIDVSQMDEEEIKTANTDSQVFLKASISVFDAIEDIQLNIMI